jgi:hypothetical protein
MKDVLGVVRWLSSKEFARRDEEEAEKWLVIFGNQWSPHIECHCFSIIIISLFSLVINLFLVFSLPPTFVSTQHSLPSTCPHHSSKINPSLFSLSFNSLNTITT